jgi:type II secretory pathway pseudopilin PulG
MNVPLTERLNNAAGLAGIEMLIVFALLCVIAGFACVHLAQERQATSRKNTAVEFATYLQKARLDSMRRNAKDINQMAQVKVFNRSMYSVAIDADGDGYLDIPLVTSLEKQGVEISGPFPKTFIFDWLGQTVDSQNHRSPPPIVTLGNGSGASAIKFTEAGDIVVVPAAKPNTAQ